MASIETLPEETLEYICELFAEDEVRWVCALALTNKRCYAAANKYRYQDIRFKVTSRSKLYRDVKQWSKRLRLTQTFASVRRLTFLGKLREYDDNASDTGEGTEFEVAESEDELTSQSTSYGGTINVNGLSKLPLSQENNWWAPVATFLAQLSGLRDLVWSLPNLFPPCLLTMLHQGDHSRSCKLHIMRFKLPSFHRNRDDPHDIDPYVLSLATSPRLTSVLVHLSRVDGDKRSEYNGGTALQLPNLAPNLINIHIKDSSDFHESPTHDEIQRRARTPPHESNDHTAVQSLRCLSLQSANRLNDFQAWQTHVDFSKLQTLQLWSVGIGVLEMVSRCHFPSLNALVLDPHEFHRRNQHAYLDTLASTFISSLAPNSLRSIHLTRGSVHFQETTKTLQAILTHHGATLEKLSLVTRSPFTLGEPLSTRELERIRSHCPNLRDLRLHVQRHEGTAPELEIYRVLGTFPHLRDLTLRLETRGTLYDRLGSKDLNEEERNAVRSMLINSAVDETLVKAIFTLITSSSPGSFSPLRRLRVECATGYGIYHTLLRILFRMHCSLKCHRYSYEGEERLIVRKRRDPVQKRFGGDCRDWLGRYEGVFQELWPGKSSTWIRNWRSFPLEVDGSY